FDAIDTADDDAGTAEGAQPEGEPEVAVDGFDPQLGVDPARLARRDPRLGEADVLVAEQQRAVQVGQLDTIEIDHHEVADAGCREVAHDLVAQGAGAEQQDRARPQSVLVDLRQQALPMVAVAHRPPGAVGSLCPDSGQKLFPRPPFQSFQQYSRRAKSRWMTAGQTPSGPLPQRQRTIDSRSRTVCPQTAQRRPSSSAVTTTGSWPPKALQASLRPRTKPATCSGATRPAEIRGSAGMPSPRQMHRPSSLSKTTSRQSRPSTGFQ